MNSLENKNVIKITSIEDLSKELKKENYNEIKITPSYLGGLFDGDGSIYISYNGEKNTTCKSEDEFEDLDEKELNMLEDLTDEDENNTLNSQNRNLIPCVGFTQCTFPIIMALRNLYGGYIRYTVSSYTDGNNVNKARGVYDLLIRGRCTKKILDDLQKGIIIKKEQVDLCLEFHKLYNKRDKDGYEQRLILKTMVENLNNLRNGSKKPYEKINDEYVAGLFDSDGCCYIDGSNKEGCLQKCNKFYMKITQRNDMVALQKIKDYYNTGRIGSTNGTDNDIWVLSSKSSLPTMKRIKETAQIKKNQIASLINVVETYADQRGGCNTPSSETIAFRKKELGNIQKEKYAEWILSEQLVKVLNDEQKAKNKEYFNELKNIAKKIKDACGRERVLCEACFEEMSRNNLKRHIKEFCKKNPNRTYVPVDKEDRYKRVVDSNIGKNRVNLTDQNIIDIKKSLSLGESLTKLGNLFNVCRSVISSIRDGLILTEEERNDPTKKADLYKKLEDKKINRANLKELKDQDEDAYLKELRNKTSDSNMETSVDTMIKILRYKHDPKETSISVALTKGFTKLNGDLMTNDIVKNLWCGKTKLREYHFTNKTDMTYEEYQKIIDKDRDNVVKDKIKNAREDRKNNLEKLIKEKKDIPKTDLDFIAKFYPELHESAKDVRAHHAFIRKLENGPIDRKVLVDIYKEKFCADSWNDVASKYKNKKGEELTLPQIKCIWDGQISIYDFDFKDRKDITYDLYVKTKNMGRKEINNILRKTMVDIYKEKYSDLSLEEIQKKYKNNQNNNINDIQIKLIWEGYIPINKKDFDTRIDISYQSYLNTLNLSRDDIKRQNIKMII
jgi:hypothetical protein